MKNKKEYVPYGPGWEREMMKRNKAELVQFLKKVLIEKRKTATRIGKLKSAW
jgi:hypothetical protein